ncbi:MAG: polysaccharide deacetylase family protein [Peptococcaceae bacterium]|nr:polysaccharide deacetylase family protein [Peptococcaceae bacterium]
MTSALALSLALALLIAAGMISPPFVRDFRAGTLPVLVYHCIGTPPNKPDRGKSLDYLYVAPEDFAWQIAWLKKAGYRFLTPAEALTWQKGEKAALITFDDGYEDNYSQAYPILRQYGGVATVFVVAGDIGHHGRLTAAQLKEMADSGLWTVGCHGYRHQDLTSYSASELREDLRLGQQTLADITGQSIEAVAYPFGAYDERVTAAATDFFECGFIADPQRDGRIGPERMTIPREGVWYDRWAFRRLLRKYFPN